MKAQKEEAKEYNILTYCDNNYIYRTSLEKFIKQIEYLALNDKEHKYNIFIYTTLDLYLSMFKDDTRLIHSKNILDNYNILYKLPPLNLLTENKDYIYREHYNKNIYYDARCIRLFLWFDSLFSKLDRLMVCDCTIKINNIKTFYNIDFKNNYIIAFNDFNHMHTIKKFSYYNINLKQYIIDCLMIVKPNIKYNLEEIRDKLLYHMNSIPYNVSRDYNLYYKCISLEDQDIINIVFDNRILYLDSYKSNIFKLYVDETNDKDIIYKGLI